MTAVIRCCGACCQGAVIYTHVHDYVLAGHLLAPDPLEDALTTPTQLSLAHLRRDGWLVDICERWVPNGGPGPGIRRDLFGLVDLVAVRGTETVGVQTTSHDNVSAHLRKMTDTEHAPAVAALHAAGWTLIVHGWRKSTRDGAACPHGRKARCGCRWTLHRDVVIPRPIMETP